MKELRKPGIFISLIHGYMLFLLSGAFISLWQEMRGFTVEAVAGDPLTRGLLLVGYMITLPMLILNPRRTLSAIMRVWWIWPLVGWAMLSVFWSNLPSLTLRRFLAASLTTLYAFVLYENFSLKPYLNLLAIVLLISLGISLAFIYLLPSWGVMVYPHPGAWRGIYIHKNTLGVQSLFGVLSLGYYFYTQKKWGRLVGRIGVVLALITLIGSRSATAMAVGGSTLIGAFLIGILLRTGRKLRLFLLILNVGLLVWGGIWLFKNYPLVLQILGRETNLTGRVQVWQLAFPLGLERSWLGWGYGAFWLDWELPSGLIWSEVNWQPKHAHNGYLDLFLNLGAPGFIFGLLLLAIPGVYMLRFLQQRLTSDRVALMLLWLILVGLNVSESMLFRQNSLYWVMMVLLNLYTLESKHHSIQIVETTSDPKMMGEINDAV
jgi:O-antigen ligase